MFLILKKLIYLSEPDTWFYKVNKDLILIDRSCVSINSCYFIPTEYKHRSVHKLLCLTGLGWGEFFKYVICTFICVDSLTTISKMHFKQLNAILKMYIWCICTVKIEPKMCNVVFVFISEMLLMQITKSIYCKKIASN